MKANRNAVDSVAIKDESMIEIGKKLTGTLFLNGES